MKTILIIVAVLIFGACKGNFLTLKYLPNYPESNTCENYPYLDINQKLYFDQRKWIDQENTTVLNIKLKVPVDSVINKIIDINADSDIVDYRYGMLSVWYYTLSKNQLAGTIKITKANAKRVVIQEALFDVENNLKINGKRRITVTTNN